MKTKTKHYSLLAMAVLWFLCAEMPERTALAYEIRKFPMQECHLELKSAAEVDGALDMDIRAPELVANEWIVYEPYPPTMQTSQQLKRAEVMVFGRTHEYNLVDELSQLHRKIIQIIVPVQNSEGTKHLKVTAKYRMSLFAKKLVNGSGQSEILSIQERDWNLLPGKTLDFKSPEFQNWMQEKGLRKVVQERDLDFAWRVFQKLRQLYSYNFDENQLRTVSNLCRSNATDCGGLSFLFSAIMRANSIPSRPLIGRWLKSEPDMDSTTPMRGQFHVKAEVYCEHIGWIPVDMALAVSENGVAGNKYFGDFDGSFICFHSNPDMIVDSLGFGKHDIPYMQAPLFWVKGGGGLEKIDVRRYWQTSKSNN